jgi:CubicO group peptidase (beta-lactamase class C family)
MTLSMRALAAMSLLLGGCVTAPPPPFDAQLARLVEGEDAPAAAAVAVMVGDQLVYAGAAGCAAWRAPSDQCARPFRISTKVRVASISKMALAIGLMTLVDEGKVALEAPASDYLGWPLVNPAFPDRPIAVRHLLSHTSSVRDPEEYWIAAPGRFRSLFEDSPPFAPRSDKFDYRPGAWFEYANLNYGILAGVIEGASGERFDRFMTARLFAPLGLDVGYNWSGVSQAARRAGGALAERRDGGVQILVDPPDVLDAELPYFLAQDGVDRAAYLSSYRPGDNPTLFSPQGGLRASVLDLLALVRRLREEKALSAPVWRYDENDPNGETEGGFYRAFGLGVQTVESDAALFPGVTMIGHSGDAYGLHSGAWLSPADDAQGRPEDVAIAFIATGVRAPAPKGAHPTFNAVEERLLRIALAAAAQSFGAVERPFASDGDATEAVDAALSAAAASGKRAAVILGSNDCHDSRSLARKMATAPLRRVLERSFVPVFVDVGARDRNLDIAQRFGVEKLVGTPTILILSPDGALLNGRAVADLRDADSRSLQEALEYFQQFAPTAD